MLLILLALSEEVVINLFIVLDACSDALVPSMLMPPLYLYVGVL